jgi:hypothetical protein
MVVARLNLSKLLQAERSSFSISRLRERYRSLSHRRLAKLQSVMLRRCAFVPAELSDWRSHKNGPSGLNAGAKERVMLQQWGVGTRFAYVLGVSGTTPKLRGLWISRDVR